MTGTGQDDVDRALAAVGAKSFVYRSFRRQPRPAEVPATNTEPASVEAPEDSAEPEPTIEIAASPEPEPAAPPIAPVEEPLTMPARDEGPALVRTFEAAAPVFVTAPRAAPPPPPNAAVAEAAAVPPASPRSPPEPAATSNDADRQSVAHMFRLLTGRAEPPRGAEPPRQPEPRRRAERIAASISRSAPPQSRPDPPSLGFGLANHLSSRIGAAEPQPRLRDIRPERQLPVGPTPGVTRPAASSSGTSLVDEGLFRRL